jgi:lipopolysaccharide/colanic/teichoic acid biosynthesis glycosyltransferase
MMISAWLRRIKKLMARRDLDHNEVQQEPASGLPAWKRALDLAAVAILLPGVICVGGAVATVVACGSRGPVFFRQRRVGHKGREFVCYKFRTMHADVETESHKGHTTSLIKSGGAMTKLDAGNDPRVIPMGKILRATGLDELPQLVNVLRGEMSLVGPRPCLPHEFELHEPWQKRRFDAVPGLTGLWQVSGKNKTTFIQMIRLDIEYSRHASLWLDLKIILKTLPALWKQCQETRSRKQKEATSSRAGMTKPVQSYQA